ncbi:MAG: hypothetical protein WC712_05700 [Candidatus Brocadiia bacterium]
MTKLPPKHPGKAIKMPFTLRGASTGGYGLAMLSGTMVFFGVFSIAFGLSGKTGTSLALGTGMVVAVLFGVLLVSSIFGIMERSSYLSVTKEGLSTHGSPRARSIPWSEIHGFRLGHTSLKIDCSEGTGDLAVRREDVVGPVKILLKRGEYELPDRYGMGPVELRNLLHRARMICVDDPCAENVPEPFGNPATLTPVIQNDDLDSLRNAASHLASFGFSGSIVPEDQLKATERKPWISTARGGYVLCLSIEQDIQKAMQALAEHLKEREEELEKKEGSPC